MFADKAFTRVYVITSVLVCIASGITTIMDNSLWLIFMWAAVSHCCVMLAYERGKKSREWKRFGR